MKPMRRTFEKLVVISVAVYLVSLLTVLIIVFNPPPVQADPSSRKTLTWIVFNTICVGGFSRQSFQKPVPGFPREGGWQRFTPKKNRGAPSCSRSLFDARGQNR
ncbi:MAG: hypothetical protein FGF48_03610 [Candidatus Brockarchaeota archaeon]|nr:hypothetical protein [Candidatus Brockarchaeota archaeon]